MYDIFLMYMFEVYGISVSFMILFNHTHVCKTNKFSDLHYTSFFLSSGTRAECGKLQERGCKRVYEMTKQAPSNSGSA